MMPPIALSPWADRKVWIGRSLLCPTCGFRAYTIANAGELWLTCQREERRRRCRAVWRAIVLPPGAIGGTFAALFGHDTGRALLDQIVPAARGLSDDEAWSLALVPQDSRPLYLQLSTTAAEQVSGPSNWQEAWRVMAALVPAGS